MYKILLIHIKRFVLFRFFLVFIIMILLVWAIFTNFVSACTVLDNNNIRLNCAYAYDCQNEYDIHKNAYFERLASGCTDEDRSALSEYILADSCILNIPEICLKNTDSEHFSLEYADGYDTALSEYMVSDFCNHDISEICSKNAYSDGFHLKSPVDYGSVLSEYMVPGSYIHDIAEISLKKVDSGDFYPECVGRDNSALPEHILSDSCISDIAEICLKNTDSEHFSLEYADGYDTALSEYMVSDFCNHDISEICSENAYSDGFHSKSPVDYGSVLSEYMVLDSYIHDIAEICSKKDNFYNFVPEYTDGDCQALSDFYALDIPENRSENAYSDGFSSEYADGDDPALWHLTFCLPNGEIQEHTVSMSLTGPSDDPALPEYILADPYIPVELLAEAASVPILRQKIYEKDVLIWPTTPVAFVFIADRPEIISVSTSDNKTTVQIHAQPLSPTLLPTKFTIPLAYLDVLGFSYNLNPASKHIVIYFVNSKTDLPDVVWQTVFPILLEILRMKSICIATAITNFYDTDIDISQKMYLFAEGMHGRRLGRSVGSEENENFCGEDVYILCEISPGRKETDNMATFAIRIMQGEYPDILPEIFVVK